MSLRRLGLGDTTILAAAGTNSAMSSVNKFGRNSAVAIATEEEIWDGSAAYVYPATALMTSMSQTTDQVAARGLVIEVQGLDSTWALVVQTKALNAADTTTAVDLDTPLIRVFRMRVLGNVVTTSTIRVHNAAENQDYAIIDTGRNQTQMAIYTVPAGKTAYMTSYYASVNPGTNLDPTSNPIRLYARDNANGYAKQIKHSIGLISGQFQHYFEPHYKFTEKTDIFITATPVGKAADVSAGFDIILINN